MKDRHHWLFQYNNKKMIRKEKVRERERKRIIRETLLLYLLYGFKYHVMNAVVCQKILLVSGSWTEGKIALIFNCIINTVIFLRCSIAFKMETSTVKYIHYIKIPLELAHTGEKVECRRDMTKLWCTLWKQLENRRCDLHGHADGHLRDLIMHVWSLSACRS